MKRFNIPIKRPVYLVIMVEGWEGFEWTTYTPL